ncbi:breast cancer type 1 susceptibility protein homolog isoform X2 [Macrobrachium nipponense]|uniref:breast cancer type 1 susceptibility protein homolog isoform X2 n=1 Tax=Macrobrachium nipponense TaxID=159736 RepID=UPI0030C82FDA
MEDRLNQMNAVMQSMQKTLECNICLDLLNQPLTTKCGHSFCTDCIHQVVKNSRNAAQCPLCLRHVTRRSLGHNRKIIELVAAVRDIIASIKRDCCFEVTPSKYRPRRQPVIPCEEDDSENEENDEPRRGMRKRAVTSHYNPEVYVPKPRAKPAKQRILASSSGEELNLCIDGKTEMTAVNAAPLHGETTLHSYITQEHSYSSPTKQEPHERSAQIKGSQPGKSKGKVASRGKSRSLAVKSGKVVTKPIHTYMNKVNDDDHISASQQADNKMDFNEAVLNGGEGTSASLGCKLDHETSTDKVEKWLNNSREVGFRIGLKQSSDSMFVPSSEGSQSLHVIEDQKAVKSSAALSLSSLKVLDGTSSSDSKVIKGKAPCDIHVGASDSANDSGHTSSHSKMPKFFKSKGKNIFDADDKDFDKNDFQKFDVDDIETVIFETRNQFKGTPDDPYKFIPSQKTPKQKVQSKRGRVTRFKARGSLNITRGRMRVRGQGTRASVPGVMEDRRDSVADFGLQSSTVSHTQSTPAVKGKNPVQELNVSIIKKPDVTINQKGPRESTIVCTRDDDDDDDYYGIPDSCPVNTKDEFDEMVSDVKEKTLSIREENDPTNLQNDEEEENLLFITPAQGTGDSEAKDGALPDVGKAECLAESMQMKEGTKRNKSKITESKKTIVANKSSKLSKSKKESSDSESSNHSNKSNVAQKMSKAVKAREEIEAIKALFDEVDEHQLSTVSIDEDEKQRKIKDTAKDHKLRQDISWHNQTLENTELNKTITEKKTVPMPPPKAPLRSRKVKFLPDLSKTHPVPSTSHGNELSTSSKSVTSASACVAKSSRGRGLNKPSVKTNVRYGSEAKQKILEPNKIQAVSINIKDTKSPGWSHVTGAQKDLKTRHTSLNITGGEQRNESDTKSESVTHNHTSYIPSSLETNLIIDDQTQENDIEHLQSSQSKVERAKKLKRIVQQLRETEGDRAEVPKLCEDKIPESIQEQVLDQQNDVDKEESVEKILVKEREIEQESQVGKSSANYPTETEPFECSDLPIDPPDLTPSCITSIGNTQPKKRKADDASSEDIQSRQTKKPSKLARKTFDLRGKRDNGKDVEKHVKTAKNGALGSARISANLPHKDREILVTESPLCAANPLQKEKALGTTSKPCDDSQATSIKDVTKPASSAPSEFQISPAVSVSLEVQQSAAVNAPSSFRPSPLYPDTFPEKPRLPHHTISPSMASTSRASLPEEVILDSASTSTSSLGIQSFTSHVIPFKKVGALSTKRCVTASEEAAKLESCGSFVKDLCLHSVPCEVYQVLMKYMNLLLTEKERHSECCSGKVELSGRTCSLGSQELPKMGSHEKQVMVKEDVNVMTEKGDDENNSGCVNNHPYDSEVPNSCDTEELEMAIPLPVSGIATRSARDRGKSNIIRHSFVKETREKKELNEKIGSKSFSATDSLKPKSTGRDKENVTNNRRSTRDSQSSQPTLKVSQSKEDKSGCHKETSQDEKEVVDQCEAEWGQFEEASELMKTDEPDNNCISEISSSIGNKSVKPSSSTKTSSQDSEKCIEKEFDQVEDCVPSSCEIDCSQQSTSLLSATDLNSVKYNHVSKIEEKLQKQNPKNKERSASLKINADVVDIEKENLKNRSNLQLAINRPKRRPLQSGLPDLQNIMSQGFRDAKSPVNEKIETSQLGQLSQTGSKLLSQRPSSTKCLVVNDVNSSGRSTRGNAPLDNKSSNSLEDRELIASGSALEDDDNSTQRKFKRIKRPVSSSSSEDSDSENITVTRKRKLKVVSSGSDRSFSGKKAKIDRKGEKQEGQHILDSEEMTVMERFDQNVWEYFGHPDMDLMEGKEKGQESPITIEDASQSDKHVDQLIPSDEDIPNTDDVMRNVEADLALIKKMRENKNDSQITVDLSSQVSDHSSLNVPSLSVNTKSLLNKADGNLSVAENLLDSEDALLQDFCTPVVKGKKISVKATLNNVERPSKSFSTSTVTKGFDAQVIGESDEESEGDLDNVSHGSAHSSQSEAISTQKHKQVQSEVEVLKARVRELEAEMKKKSNEKQISDKNSKGSEQPVNHKETKDDKGHESEEELFSSLPDFNPSTEPSLPLTNKPSSSVSSRSTGKAVCPPVREAYHLVCTGLNSNEMLKVDEFIKRVATAGSSLKKSWASNVTHVIVKTDKDMLAQRTLKYLYGVAAGCWVISLQWVFDSLSLNKVLPEIDYEVLDCTGAPGPRRSRTYFKPIFENYEFFLKPPFLEVSVDQLKDLLELCGARIIKSPGEFSQNKNVMKLIIVQTDTKHDVQSYLTKYQKVTLGHDWIIECVGMHSHVCITPFVVGNPRKHHFASSGIPAALLEESQELSCSQVL